VKESEPVQESLLIFSDVHLGSDLNDCSLATMRRTTSIDRDLVALLSHYRKQRATAHGNARWRVVIAGDFIDFIGMSIRSEQTLEPMAPLTEEERLHGLGSGQAHAREKLRRVAIRHADVFAELAGFVAEGHALTLIHGNHDIELHWDGVKEDFRAILLSIARIAKESSEVHAESFLSRIDFEPWFFYRDGVAYIEHGHQYDPFCATSHVMSPVSPLDTGKVARGFSETLLRFVVRPTRGMTEHGHERFGMHAYLAFALRLGFSGMLRLGLRFVRAIRELFRIRRGHLSAASKALRASHERRIAQLAKATRFGKKRLQSLLSLQAVPIAHSISGIMASLMLDRLALGFAALLALLVLVAHSLIGRSHPSVLVSGASVLFVWAIVHIYLSRKRTVDPAATMVLRAEQLARIFPAAFVVMGHTHVPVEQALGNATYINLGSWAEDEPLESPDETGGQALVLLAPAPAARTHLVIHVNDGNAEARFYTWDAASESPMPIADRQNNASARHTMLG
jgi:UDP-2,3-diacylglucosamine pyrophosphatase LpxH